MLLVINNKDINEVSILHQKIKDQIKVALERVEYRFIITPKPKQASFNAVYNFALALNNFSGTFQNNKDVHVLDMTKDLSYALLDFLNKTNGKYINNTEEFSFKQKCTTILKNNFHHIIAEPVLWTSIKDLLNDLCQTIEYSPETTLDINTMNTSLKARFQTFRKTTMEINEAEEAQNRLSFT